MGSCTSRCNQKNESIPTQYNDQYPINNNFAILQTQAAIKLQANIRGFLERRQFTVNIIIKRKHFQAKNKRSQNQKLSNSTDEMSLQISTPIQKIKTINITNRILKNKQISNEIQSIESALRLKTSSMHENHAIIEDSIKEESSGAHLQSSKNGPQIISSSVDIENSNKWVNFEQDIKQREFSFQINKFIFNEMLCFQPIDLSDMLALSKNPSYQLKLPSIRMKNNATYEGQWKAGKPNGQGTYTFPDKSRYIGQWEDGNAEGKGIFYHQNGDIFEGEFHKNLANGTGKYKYVNGGYYEGLWVNDQPNGIGYEMYDDGSYYQGQFVSGHKHGKGLMTFKDGSTYEGQFQNDEMNGTGIYKWWDGRVYEGSWKNSLMHGKGILIWPDGRKYIGEYFEDKKHGYGIYELIDGRRYIGYWKDGYQDGEGEFIGFNGKITKGIWKKGKLQQHTQSSYPSQHEYSS